MIMCPRCCQAVSFGPWTSLKPEATMAFFHPDLQCTFELYSFEL